MEVVGEPQGVAELMARTEADWKQRAEACDDATAADRAALCEALGDLRAEYEGADYARKAAIERELKALMRRHAALDAGTAADAEAEAPAPPEIPEPAFAPVPPEPAPEAAPEPAPPDHAEAPHGPVPLGPESAVRPRGDEPGPGREGPHGPVPLGPESAVRGAPPFRPVRPPTSPPGASGPIPHGAPGTGSPFGQPRGESRDAPRADAPGGTGRPDGAWRAGEPGMWGRWLDRARLTAEREVLRCKREARLMEVGVRIRQLEARGALGAAADDAGVRARLAQVARVEARIAEVRTRLEALRVR